MSRDKIEFVQKLTTGEAARFLRDIAVSLENGRVELEDAALDWSEVRKLEVSLQNRDGEVSLKTELKPWADHPKRESKKGKRKDLGSSDRTEDKRKPFKALKKDMERTFQGIRSSLQQGTLPTPEEAQKLHEQAREMEQQAGPGREEYLSFLRLAEGFAHAVNDGDPERAPGLVGDLERAEKECHAKYK